MSTLVIYEDDGRIISVDDQASAADCEFDYSPLNTACYTEEVTVVPNVHYFDTQAETINEITAFPTLTQRVDDMQTFYRIVLDGLPNGTTVEWPDGFMSYEEGGRLTADVEFVGEYAFLLSNVKHKDKRELVNVTS